MTIGEILIECRPHGDSAIPLPGAGRASVEPTQAEAIEHAGEMALEVD
jgi:hypothetical protein